MSKHENSDVRVPINPDSLSITRDDSLCILCGNCRSVCKYNQGVYGNYDLEKTGDRAICIDCGQCANVCPTGAIMEVQDYLKVKKLIKNKENIVIFQTAPSIKVSFTEEFGMPIGSVDEKKLVAALRKLGASYVFDTCFGADVTIIEEAHELVERIKEDRLPMFTSCCPAWVKFIEIFYPKYIPNLSTCKSPILMQGALLKSYFCNEKKIDPSKIIHVAITPCTAKKAEIKGVGNDIDYVITTREFARWVKEEGIDIEKIEDSKYDTLMSTSSGAGVIFGTSGGVMQAALRTAHFYLTGKPMEKLVLKELKGCKGIKEATVEIGGKSLKVAVITGTADTHFFFSKLEKGKQYDFIEGMACIGGCIAGGGQPKVDLTKEVNEKEKRSDSLYEIDLQREKRNSYENPEVKKLYDTYLKEPGSKKSKELLHRTYESKCHLLDIEKIDIL